MFGVFKLNSYFCNGIKYRLKVHVNENICIRLLSKKLFSAAKAQYLHEITIAILEYFNKIA